MHNNHALDVKGRDVAGALPTEARKVDNHSVHDNVTTLNATLKARSNNEGPL